MTSAYRPDIDGLRCVAVLSVVLNHLSERLAPGGYVGVDVFFVISGYLITRIIQSEVEQGSFSFAVFYERRLRRLFPALFGVLLFVIVAGYVFALPSDYRATLRASLGTLGFSSNIVFWRELQAGYFAPNARINPLLHTWSLAVEEQFYLLYPVFLIACNRLFPRLEFRIMLALAAVSLVAAEALVRGHSVAVFFLLPFRGWELMVGGLLALRRIPLLSSRASREFVAAAGLGAIVASVIGFGEHTTFPGLSATLPVAGAAAIIHAGASGPTTVGALLAMRPIVYVGLISYSLYLWHWPLIVFTRFALAMAPLDRYVPALLVSSLALGALSHRLIELPFRRPTSRSRAHVFAASFAGSAVLALLGAAGLWADGVPSRFSERVIALDRARSPIVPLMECDGAVPPCTLGAPGASASTVLWGDSHLLAWAPALDQIFRERGEGALLATTSACPPILGISVARQPGCRAANERVRVLLDSRPELRNVVLVGYWSTYFDGNALVTLPESQGSPTGADAMRSGLGGTLRWLSERHRLVAVIGPVPTYSAEVPLALALAEASGARDVLPMTQASHRERHEPFFDALGESLRPGQRLIDPAEWACASKCVVEVDGVPLYRDAHHLSVAGATEYADDLDRALEAAFAP